MSESDQPDRVEHRMERTYFVPATPEQAWEAIATAQGISAWMMPTRLDPQVGGEVAFVMDDFTSTGVVTDYTPHTRFAYEEPWPIAAREEDVPAGMRAWFDSIGVSLARVHADLASVSPIATEYLVEAESGGSCVVRVVTSAYGSGADWENEFFDQMAASLIPILDHLATHLGAPLTTGAQR
ncbi:SRPBCC domain-containing protein [Aeromicrobium alkaliterrae]|uniref:Activator of Hsp90 ATPase homologue 1/2-like C-terminal domain-containing protein n=1 Tax=Aeromicrobium alkaliterrae TaxID=302168 RepID=A0ABP4VHH9_9ACTN